MNLLTNGMFTTFLSDWNWTLGKPAISVIYQLHGTELSDVKRIKILLQNPVPMASNVHKLLTVLFGENDASVINHRNLKEWWHTSVRDVHQAFLTIQQFWNEDQFYLKTLNIPVVEQLGRLNVTELAENITSVQAVLLAEVERTLKTAAEEDLVNHDQLELLKVGFCSIICLAGKLMISVVCTTN